MIVHGVSEQKKESPIEICAVCMDWSDGIMFGRHRLPLPGRFKGQVSFSQLPQCFSEILLSITFTSFYLVGGTTLAYSAGLSLRLFSDQTRCIKSMNPWTVHNPFFGYILHLPQTHLQQFEHDFIFSEVKYLALWKKTLAKARRQFTFWQPKHINLFFSILRHTQKGFFVPAKKRNCIVVHTINCCPCKNSFCQVHTYPRNN